MAEEKLTWRYVSRATKKTIQQIAMYVGGRW